MLLSHISDSEFTKIVENSINYADVLRKCNVSTNANNYIPLKKRIIEMSLSVSHFIKGYSKERISMSLDDILVENSSYNRSHLKRRLINENILDNRCSVCGLDGNWNGKPITMILDHINGINNDNRINNLRLVCPNCNSQLPTHAGRNVKHKLSVTTCIDCGINISRRCKRCKSCDSKYRVGLNRKVIRPSKTELFSLLKKETYTSVAKKFGVSDNTIRKWVISYGADPKKIKINR